MWCSLRSPPEDEWISLTSIRPAQKDSFSLPKIDLLVDLMSGHDLLNFMDTFSGYNQIRIRESDHEKIASITDMGLYCYKVMPFELKNTGATYQRLVNKMFKHQIGKT